LIVLLEASTQTKSLNTSASLGISVRVELRTGGHTRATELAARVCGGYSQRREPPMDYRLCAPRDRSGHFNLPGLFAAAFPVVLENERHLVTVVERTYACAFEGSRVHKHILGTVSRRDEPEAFCTVEKLYRSSDSHDQEAFPSREREPVNWAHA